MWIKQEHKQFIQTELSLINGTLHYDRFRFLSRHYTNKMKIWTHEFFSFFFILPWVTFYELPDDNSLEIEICSSVQCHLLKWVWLYCFIFILSELCNGEKWVIKCKLKTDWRIMVKHILWTDHAPHCTAVSYKLNIIIILQNIFR